MKCEMSSYGCRASVKCRYDLGLPQDIDTNASLIKAGLLFLHSQYTFWQSVSSHSGSCQLNIGSLLSCQSCFLSIQKALPHALATLWTGICMKNNNLMTSANTVQSLLPLEKKIYVSKKVSSNTMLQYKLYFSFKFITCRLTIFTKI